MTLPKNPPKYKTQDSFRVPQGLYKLRAGTLNNQLQLLYSGYMNGALTKSQVNLTGQHRIKSMGEILKSDVGRWLRGFKQGTIDPTIWTDVDRWTREKQREWENIVNDM